MKKVIGIIPAAGSGSRLYPYNGAKEILPVGTQNIVINGKNEKRPKIISQYIIEAMAFAGVSHIIIITNSSKQKLMDFHLDGSAYGVTISYIIQNSISMPHSIDFAYELIKNATVVMGMPDTVILPNSSLQQLLKKHVENNADLSLGLFKTNKSYKFGMIKTDDRSNIIYHSDKPTHTDASFMWGIAVWEPCLTQILHEHILERHNLKKELILGDIFDIMMTQEKKCKAHQIVDGRYYDIGTYDDYKKAILEL